MENYNTDDDTGNRFQGAEDGSAFTANEEGALLKQNDRTGRNQQREQNAKAPAGKGGWKNEMICDDTNDERADAAHQNDIEGKQKAGHSGTVKAGKHNHIRGECNSGKQ